MQRIVNSIRVRRLFIKKDQLKKGEKSCPDIKTRVFSSIRELDQLSIFGYLYEDYKIRNKIRLIELFAGVGSQSMALRDLGADFESYRVVEFDKYAIKSYNAIHGTNFPTIDIRDIHCEDLGIVDKQNVTYLLTYSFPCQDLSKAGKQRGMTKGSGTRSGLLWEVERILNECKEKDSLPQVLLMENVPDVIGSKNYEDFMKWYATLENMGYQSYYKVLNAKDYGIPQNRERCFMVSILGDYNYTFPRPIPLKLRLKDMLEEQVDEKYYLSQDKVNKYVKKFDQTPYALLGGEQGHQSVKKDGISTTLTSSMGCGGGYVPMINEPSIKELGFIKKSEKGTQHQSNTVYHPNGLARTLAAGDYKAPLQILESKRIGGLFDDEKGKHQAGSVWDTEHLAPTLDTMQGGYRQPCVVVPEATKKGYAEAEVGDSINLEQPNSQTRRGRVGKQVAQTLTTSCNQGVLGNGTRIRKLTPKECWRLMGFTDEDFEKAQKVNSNTQLYKQAGNSIVKQVLMAIFKQMID